LEDDPDGDSGGQRHFKAEQMLKVPKVMKSRLPTQTHPEPLIAAVLSTRSYPPQRFKRLDWEETWLARACVVAVHELGHCFGLDHCVYYACVMQGTASVAEDTQQPPYLCPICQSKVAYTAAIEPVPTRGRRRRTIEEVGRMERRWTLKQYAALKEYCDARSGGVMFKGFGAWLQSRITQMESDPTVLSREQGNAPNTEENVTRSASHFSAMEDGGL
jgi:archaemetzincin